MATSAFLVGRATTALTDITGQGRCASGRPRPPRPPGRSLPTRHPPGGASPRVTASASVRKASRQRPLNSGVPTRTSVPASCCELDQITTPDNFSMSGTGPWCRRMPGQRHSAPPVGLEPTTRCLEGSCSIHLSYGGWRSVNATGNGLAEGPWRSDRLVDSLVAVAQVVRASGCGPEGRGFESPRSPQGPLLSWPAPMPL